MSEMKGWIPIRPHLLRYVEWRECLVAGHPIVIPGMTIIAQALDLCLTNKTSYLTSTIRREESRVHEYSGRLHYLVHGITRCRYNFHFVTAQQGMAFNIFLHHAMHDDLLRLIQAGQAAGQYEINIIKNFLDETGMDELINYESVKKAQYRLRQAKAYSMQKGRTIRGTVFSTTRVKFAAAG